MYNVNVYKSLLNITSLFIAEFFYNQEKLNLNN